MHQTWRNAPRLNKHHPLCKVINAWWLRMGLPELHAKMFKQQIRHLVVKVCPEARFDIAVITPPMLEGAMKAIPALNVVAYPSCKPYEKARRSIVAILNKGQS